MNSKRLLQGLNYRQAQKRNSDVFNSLSKKQRKKVREQGYRNIGWDNVIKSWNTLNVLNNKKPLNFVNFAIEKAEKEYQKAKQQEDLLEILETGKSVIRALKMKYQ